MHNNQDKGIICAGCRSKKIIFPVHPLINIKVSKYYSNYSRFHGVFSRDNLPKLITNGVYVINLDEYKDTGTHWVALLCIKKASHLF